MGVAGAVAVPTPPLTLGEALAEWEKEALPVLSREVEAEAVVEREMEEEGVEEGQREEEGEVVGSGEALGLPLLLLVALGLRDALGEGE